MPAIHVNVTNLGAASHIGGVRYNLPDRSVIVLHAGLPVDEQAALIAELSRPDETPVYVNVPEQRQGEADGPVRDRRSVVAARLRAAAVAASVIAAAGCSTPLARG